MAGISFLPTTSLVSFLCSCANLKYGLYGCRRCEVSGGVGTEWPVECHEIWRFHEGSQTLQLRGFMALHPEVHLAKHLERQQDDKRRQQAIWMLQAMNE